MHLDLLLRRREIRWFMCRPYVLMKMVGLTNNYTPSAVGMCVEMTITVVSQKSVHGWNTLQVCQRGGWVLLCETMALAEAY